MLISDNLITAATAATATPPSGITAGVALPFLVDQITVLVKSTAGSGTMTATVRVWAYFPEAAAWFSCGVLNAGNAIPETTADAIQYCEAVVGLRGASRVHAQLEAVAGTSTAITVQAIAVPATFRSN